MERQIIHMRPPNQPQPEPQKCPRCDSLNTKFCYYNNYSLSQPRYFCKTCRRYWTQGGTIRNVPVGGGFRKGKRPIIRANYSSSSSSSSLGGGGPQQAPPQMMMMQQPNLPISPPGPLLPQLPPPPPSLVSSYCLGFASQGYLNFPSLAAIDQTMNYQTRPIDASFDQTGRVGVPGHGDSSSNLGGNMLHGFNVVPNPITGDHHWFINNSNANLAVSDATTWSTTTTTSAADTDNTTTAAATAFGGSSDLKPTQWHLPGYGPPF